MRLRKKVVVDLDVVTVAEWNSKREAIQFIARIKAGEFEVYTPYSLFDLLDKWRYETLRNKIKEFYELYSTEIVTLQKLTERLDKLKINETAVTKDLKKEQIKEEDILLIIITSLFDLDFLVTLNRKHLKNKKEVINNVLRKYRLRTIRIISPDEI